MSELPDRPRIHLHNPALPILAGLVFILQILLPSRVWVILLVFLGLGWLASFLWVRLLARNLIFRRELRHDWAQVGERLQERFTVYNKGLASALWLQVDDHSNLPGFHASRVTSVDFLASTDWLVEGICTRRGRYTLGPTRLMSGDPLGLYTVTLSRPETTVLVVLPPVFPLPILSVTSGAQIGDGLRRSNLVLERSISAGWVREYQPGDQARWIHWPSTVRRNRMYVREFDSLPSSDWWIVLDLEQHSQAGQGDSSTLEHGVILAASLADRGLRERHKVGLAAFGPELVMVPPGEGPGQRLAILYALALVTPGECSLARLLEGLEGSLQHSASLVIITAAVDGTWLEALLRLVDRGMVPAVLVMDPASYGGLGDASQLTAVLNDLDMAFQVISRPMLEEINTRVGEPGKRRNPARSTAWSAVGENHAS